MRDEVQPVLARTPVRPGSGQPVPWTVVQDGLADRPGGTVGAVCVVGGGIAGIQASLDLAESGFFVYLVERSPAIGGVMPQLDKTFPTNDCAMCILAPKLVDASRHPNIQIISQAEVEGVEGEAGDFSVTVKKYPRFIDLEKCTACGDCVEVCPIYVSDAFNAGLSQRKAVYKLYPQAAPNAFAIEKQGMSSCRNACPIHQRSQGYVALIREKRYEDAYRVIAEDNPFPAICGRICDHRCEEECSRTKVDEAVSIRNLKRFVVDTVYANGLEPVLEGPPEPAEITHEEKVAIVGSGPAGLTAAQDLIRMGYPVTVFEALPVPGGMMRVGVPEYRLKRELIQREIDCILALGVDLRLNTRVENLDELFDQGYQAIFLAVGAHNGRKLPIPGADLPEVLVNTDFLRRVSMGEEVKVGRRVLVLGGGNVAMDVARTALRLGAEEVHMAFLESRKTMPAHTWETAEAEEEGIILHPSRSFKQILHKNGRVMGVECLNVTFMQFDKEGRLTLETEPGSEHVLPADTVIFAIGQGPDLSFLDVGAGLRPAPTVGVTRRRTIEVDPETLATGREGVFAGGDAVTGTAFVVDGVAAGHKAARSIDRYLRGEPLKQPEAEPLPVVELTEEEIQLKLASGEVNVRARLEMAAAPIAERLHDFREVNLGFTEEQALAEAQRCLACGICSECLECVRACQADAIDHEQREETLELKVGSIILAPGFNPFQARLKSEYGYGHFPNVITSLEFERILSASGPFGGEVLRPYDQAHPRKIAFIQCVGSRDLTCDNDYCSSVCCTYAIKEAVIAREHALDIEPTIFFMDMRTYGKGFEAYYEKARDEGGVRFIRSRVTLEEVGEGRNLLLAYETEDGLLMREEFDLAVLSLGLVPSAGVRELADRLGVELNPFGFCQTALFSPVATSRPGIFVCGAFQGPKDIPETVMQASAAASCAEEMLASARGTLAVEKEYPPEIVVSGQDPRIGVFICQCGINIGGYVDVPSVVEYAKTLPNVAYAEYNLYTCSQDTQQKIKEAIAEHGLNRIIVASCTPRTHEPLFQETIREAGLNKYLFEMANIRDQCSWVHMQDPQAATRKARDLVRMAVAKAALIQPLAQLALDVVDRGLVIGGGAAGMTAALALADQGFHTYLVERERELGGNARHIHTTLPLFIPPNGGERGGEDAQAFLRDLIEQVRAHPLIEVYTESEVREVGGYVGNFVSQISRNGEVLTLEHGAVIVATGGEEYRPTEYLYGQDPRVVTQRELEAMLAMEGNELRVTRNEEKETNDSLPVTSLPITPLPVASSLVTHHPSVVMIQCVGSRNDEHGYCSRICCSQAIKNALKIKERDPEANVYVLYRDVRAYGFQEAHYRQAREAGVMFLRYDEDDPPQIVERGDGTLTLSVTDPILGAKLLLPADLLVLSTGVVPRPDSQALAQMLKVPLNEDGFFLEAHVKLRPVEFATDGAFLCGLAHSPKALEESIAQARAVASRASALLSQKQILAEGIVASVNDAFCGGCAICEALCPYNAIEVDREEKLAKVNEALCKGCGTCCAACPSGALQQRGFGREQILAMVGAALAA